ncbi:hypothetical protein ACFQX7_38845 [Luedemannella flava]
MTAHPALTTAPEPTTAAAGPSAVPGPTSPPEPTGEPVPTGEPEATDAVCAAPEPTGTTVPTGAGPVMTAPATAYALVAYRAKAPATIDVTWVPLSSLFKTKTKPAVGDTLRFEVDISVPGKAKDLVFDLVTKCAGKKKIGTIVVTCKVTAVDDGFDAVTVTCKPANIAVEIDGKKVNIPFPATTPDITAGISIVK